MPKKYALCSDEELLQMLETRAKIRGQELEEGSPGKANSQFRIMVKLSCELIRRGYSAHQGILSLLKSGDPHVRGWAAFLALEFDASKGEEVLDKPKGSSSPVEPSISEWISSHALLARKRSE